MYIPFGGINATKGGYMPDENMKKSVKFLGLQQPKAWEMNGNRGVSYKISIAWQTEKGVSALPMKVNEGVYTGLQALNLPMGTDIVLVFGMEAVIRDNQQQAVTSVVGFEMPTAEQAKKAG